MDVQDFPDDELSKKPDLNTTITALKNNDITTILYGLSGLTAKEVETIKPGWGELSAIARRKLLRRMVEASETDFALDYREFGKMNLLDTDASVRAVAIEVLWEDESIETMRQIHSILANDEAIQVRIAAAIALGKYVLLGEYEEIPDSEIMPVQETIVNVWNDKEQPAELRRRALEAISNGSHDIVPKAIREAYNSDNSQMRTSAVFAMGKSYDHQWDEAVLAELDSDDPEILYEAAKASGHLSITEAVPKLGKLVASGDREILEIVVWSLGEIGTNEAVRMLNILAEQAEERDDTELVDAIDEAIGTATIMNGGMFTIDVDFE